MSESTVVALPGHREPERRKADQIECIELLLAKAKAGEFLAFAFVALGANGYRFTQKHMESNMRDTTKEDKARAAIAWISTRQPYMDVWEKVALLEKMLEELADAVLEEGKKDGI